MLVSVGETLSLSHTERVRKITAAKIILQRLFMAARQGLEPRLTRPKPAVLPIERPGY